MSTAPDPTGSLPDVLRDAREELGHADQKASILLAALGIGFAALLNALLSHDWGPHDIKGLALVVWWLGTLFAGVSIIAAAVAVWPRILHSKANGPVMFWGHAAQFASIAELEEHVAAHPASHEARTHDQLWHVSRILQRKYTAIRVAMILAAFSAGCYALAAVMTA